MILLSKKIIWAIKKVKVYIGIAINGNEENKIE
jgi:hypothetical protein